jgi:hypothetical protein
MVNITTTGTDGCFTRKAIIYMNDTETLEWIAAHLVSFHPLWATATLEYVDEKGNTNKVYFRSDNEESNLELLRGCIGKALNK